MSENTVVRENDMNEVTIRGYVVHIYKANKVTLMNISTRDYAKPGRLNQNGKLTHVADYPEVVFFGELGERVAEGVKEGDFVTIKGSIQSSRKPRTTQSIIAKEIEFTESLLESAIGLEVGRKYPEDKNELILKGTVRAVRVFGPHHLGLVIHTRNHGFDSFVKVNYPIRNAEEEATKIQKYSRVACACRVETSKRVREDGVKHFEQVVARELKVIE